MAAALAGKGYRSNIKPPEICTNTVGKASVVAALVKKGCGVCLRLLVLIRCRGQQVGCFILNVLSLLSWFIPLMVSCLKMFLAHKLLMLAKPVTHTRSRVPTPSKNVKLKDFSRTYQTKFPPIQGANTAQSETGIKVNYCYKTENFYNNSSTIGCTEAQRQQRETLECVNTSQSSRFP